jgi:hypothetical protein
MTCIAGIAQTGRVYLGGDSAAVDDWGRIQTRAEPKVFEKLGYAIGYTDSFRLGQLLRHKFDPPKFSRRKDILSFLCNDFVDSLRECLDSGGYATRSEGRESGGTFLVGVGGRLFKICSDYQVAEAVGGYDACGSGQQPALGSLFSTGSLAEPLERLTLALASAEAFNSNVRGPFSFATTTPPKRS